METISDYFEKAQFSQAAYASGLIKGMLGGVVQGKPSDYANLLIDGGMSQTQAKSFANQYSVIDQYNDPSSSLSVTLFEDKDGNQTIAVRGTVPTDLLDIFTDVVDIAFLGSSRFQDQYSALSDKVKEWSLSRDLRTGFSISGHSLGGFLAQALAAEFDSDVSAVYTYNAPGFTAAKGTLSSVGTELLDTGFTLSVGCDDLRWRHAA